jgi:hypothetical protein
MLGGVGAGEGNLPGYPIRRLIPLLELSSSLSRCLVDKLIVLGMRTDPDPIDVAFFLKS